MKLSLVVAKPIAMPYSPLALYLWDINAKFI